VPEARRARFQVMLGIQRLNLARQRADLPAVAVEAERLLAPIEGDALEDFGISEERHEQALVSLGTAEVWTGRLKDAERHLDDGIALARRIEQPYLELRVLAHSAMVANFRTFSLAAERSIEAIQLAQRHGWGEEPITGVAYTVLAGAMVAHARLDEADGWFARAGATLRPEGRRAAGLLLHYARGHLELVRGRDAEALADYRTAERLARQLASPHALVTRVRGQLLHALVRLGETEQVEEAIAAIDAHERENGAVRTALAALRLAQDDPEAATTALAPVLDSATPAANPTWVVAQACLLEARAATPSATPAPPSAPSNGRSISPSPTAYSYRFCSSPIQSCWSVMPGFAPAMAPSSPRSLICSPASNERRCLASRRAWPNRSATASSGSCATYRPTSPTRRSRVSCMCRSTRSRPTPGISTPSSTPTAAATPWSEPAHSACSPLRRADPDAKTTTPQPVPEVHAPGKRLARLRAAPIRRRLRA
jgi:MalT-like TPR region